MSPGTVEIKLVHPFFLYVCGGYVQSSAGELIAFLGDNTDSSSPNPVISPAQNMWTVKKTNILASEQDFVTYFANEADVANLWKRADADLAEHSIPNALCLPPTHAVWLAEQPQTPYEYLLFVANLMSGGDIWDRTGLELSLLWAAAAGKQAPNIASNTCLAITMVGIPERNSSFDKMCN